MAIFHPQSPHKETPRSERKVWRALASLDNHWHVLHHVQWQAVRQGRHVDGESDFVLVHPEHGLTVLEVKGGSVEMIDGVWTTIDGKDPVWQASNGSNTLYRHLNGLDASLVGNPRVCHGVALPDVEVLGAIGMHPRALFLDGIDLRDSAKSMERLLTHWGLQQTPLATRQVQAIVQRLAPTRTIQRTLRLDVADSEAEILELTDRQREAFRILRRTRRGIVLGSAGTGKTLLALEKARQMAADGAAVLLTCFNAPLAAWLEELTAGVEGITVASFHSLCFRTASTAGLPIPIQPSEEWWEREAANLLASAAGADTTPRFDALVVDEAQDFANDWLTALQLLLSAPDDAPVFLFADEHQQLFRKGLTLPDWPQFVLDLNCRNTRPIARKVAEVVRSPEPKSGARGKLPEFIITGGEFLVDSARRVVENLVAQIRALRVAAAARPSVSDKGLVAETIHRFKGLESEAVVLVCSDVFVRQPEWIRVLLYVGMSRARSALIILGPPSLRRFLRMR